MVVTYTQFLAKRYESKLDDTGKEFISYAVEGAHRVHMLLQALLEYWQIGEANDDPARKIDSSAVLKKALDQLAMMLTESGAVVTFSEMPTVHASESALVQLFQNLVSNAIKYRNPELPPQIGVSARRISGSEWQFSVEDNGIGIAPEHQQLIFKLFKRLNGSRYAGKGIGLALCAKIVENFGGRMWVESEVGRGSTFHFTIPA
jgi:light-regulated signal transduction histidine kinase (bacteriophytochrome)